MNKVRYDWVFNLYTLLWPITDQSDSLVYKFTKHRKPEYADIIRNKTVRVPYILDKSQTLGQALNTVASSVLPNISDEAMVEVEAHLFNLATVPEYMGDSGTVYLPRHTRSDKIIVTKDYREILSQTLEFDRRYIAKRNKEGGRGRGVVSCILGSNGSGKTSFLLFLLIYRLFRGETTIFLDSSGRYHIFPPNVDKDIPSSMDFQHILGRMRFSTYLQKTDPNWRYTAWVLVDGIRPPSELIALDMHIIMVSNPRKDIYYDIMRELKGRVYQLDGLSWVEFASLKIVRPGSILTQKEMYYLHSHFGGNLIFLNAAFQCNNLEGYKEFIRRLERNVRERAEDFLTKYEPDRKIPYKAMEDRDLNEMILCMRPRLEEPDIERFANTREKRPIYTGMWMDNFEVEFVSEYVRNLVLELWGPQDQRVRYGR